MKIVFWFGSATMFILSLLLLFHVLPEMTARVRDAFTLIIIGWLLLINAKLEQD